MAQTSNKMSARELVLERRRAMSTMGKAALTTNTAQPAPPVRSAAPASAASYSSTARTPANSSREASIARRLAMSAGGKKGIQSKDRTRGEEIKSAAPAAPTAAAPSVPATPATEKKGCGCGCDGTRAECKASMKKDAKPIAAAVSINQAKQAINHSVARLASLARREAMSTRGKAGVSKNGMTAAQTARAGNPNLNSRDMSKALREQRSKNGSAGQKKSEPCGRRRQKQETDAGGAADQPWKVGASNGDYGWS